MASVPADLHQELRLRRQGEPPRGMPPLDTGVAADEAVELDSEERDRKATALGVSGGPSLAVDMVPRRGYGRALYSHAPSFYPPVTCPG